MAPRPIADSFAGYRARLVEELRAAGVRDLAVLRAFGEVPRHLFVPSALREQAYENRSLPIGRGQTISQPATHARYLEALQLTGHERVLEVGTGTGYQAALLAFLAAHVYTVERIQRLASAAQLALTSAGLADRVAVLIGDGSLGWRPFAPYDAILVAAAGPAIPQPLIDQLADGGRLVAPVQREGKQILLKIVRRGTAVSEERIGDANFVPLIGRHGYPSPS